MWSTREDVPCATNPGKIAVPSKEKALVPYSNYESLECGKKVFVSK
jgi:hypothetical protein